MLMKNYCMQVRMTRDQYREVQRIAVDRGFSSLSDYVRYQVFDRDWTMAIQVGEIHAQLFKAPPTESTANPWPASGGSK